MTQALRALARLRDISQRYHADNRASAPLISDTHALREPIPSLEDWMPAAKKRSNKKAA
jgi:hypothetical protein